MAPFGLERVAPFWVEARGSVWVEARGSILGRSTWLRWGGGYRPGQTHCNPCEWHVMSEGHVMSDWHVISG